jgi:hypothetical protein
LNIFPVVRPVFSTHLVELSLCPEDSCRCHSAPDTHRKKHHGSDYCKQVSQNIDQKAETDEQKTGDKHPGCHLP